MKKFHSSQQRACHSPLFACPPPRCPARPPTVSWRAHAAGSVKSLVRSSYPKTSRGKNARSFSVKRGHPAATLPSFSERTRTVIYAACHAAAAVQGAVWWMGTRSWAHAASQDSLSRVLRVDELLFYNPERWLFFHVGPAMVFRSYPRVIS